MSLLDFVLVFFMNVFTLFFMVFYLKRARELPKQSEIEDAKKTRELLKEHYTNKDYSVSRKQFKKTIRNKQKITIRKKQISTKTILNILKKKGLKMPFPIPKNHDEAEDYIISAAEEFHETFEGLAKVYDWETPSEVKDKAFGATPTNYKNLVLAAVRQIISPIVKAYVTQQLKLSAPDLSESPPPEKEA